MAEIKQRGFLAPLLEYDDGTVGMGVPGLLYQPYQALARLMQSGYNPGWDERTKAGAVEDAFDAAGLAVAGSLAAPRPRGSVGMGGRPTQALDMSQEARLARAKEMGFDPRTVYYRGTTRGSVDDFSRANRNLPEGQPLNDFDGVFVTRDPQEASGYTGTIARRGREGDDFADGGGAVYPLHIRDAKPFSWDYTDIDGTLARLADIAPNYRHGRATQGDTPDLSQASVIQQALQRDGYTSLSMVDGKTGTELERVIFDPSNIRSVNAAFDPAQSSSANLLAANNPRAVAQVEGAKEAAQSDDDNALVEILRKYGLLGALGLGAASQVEGDG